MPREFIYHQLIQRLNKARETTKELAEKGLVEVNQVNAYRVLFDDIEQFISETFGSCSPKGLEQNETKLARLERELEEFEHLPSPCGRVPMH